MREKRFEDEDKEIQQIIDQKGLCFVLSQCLKAVPRISPTERLWGIENFIEKAMFLAYKEKVK